MTIGKPNTKTFCVAPWFNIRNEQDFSKRVCCVQGDMEEKGKDLDSIDFLNSEEVIKLKQDLHSGVQNSICNNCWKAEKQNVLSLRQRYLKILTNGKKELHKTWLESYFKKKENFSSDLILLADLKIGNTCNFDCVMCLPHDSSQVFNRWTNNPNSKYVKDFLNQNPDYLTSVKKNSFKESKYRDFVCNTLEKNQKLKHLKILGGEPLLDRKLLDALRNIKKSRKKNLDIQFVTNGSQDLLNVIEQIGSFKNIHFTVSLEGIGEIQDWARHGSDWAQIEKNIKQVDKLANVHVSVKHTIQAPTFIGFPSLLTWCQDNRIPLVLGVVKKPEYLSLKALPVSIRDRVFENLKKLDESNNGSMSLDDLDSDTMNYQNMKDFFSETKFDPKLYSELKNYVQVFDTQKQKEKKLIDIYPEIFEHDR